MDSLHLSKIYSIVWRISWCGAELSPKGGWALETTLVEDKIILDQRLSLAEKGLYTVICALTKAGAPIHVSDLSRRLGVERKSIRRHLTGLAAAGVIILTRSGTPGRYLWVTLGHDPATTGAEVRRNIARRLARARKRDEENGQTESVGEVLMKEWLSLLIDSGEYADNARPGFLTSPITGEPLEYDRWYPALKVAFEFQGPQHFGPTERFPDAAAAEAQKLRDLAKIGLSQRNGITLVEVEPHQLSEAGMVERIPTWVSRRRLDSMSPIIGILEAESAKYRKRAGSPKRASGTPPGSAGTKPAR